MIGGFTPQAEGKELRPGQHHREAANDHGAPLHPFPWAKTANVLVLVATLALVFLSTQPEFIALARHALSI